MDPISTMVDVLVVDDCRLFRELLAASLEGAPGVRSVMVAAGSEEALRTLPGRRPDAVLVNMAMADSVDVCRDMVAAGPGVRVLALGLDGSDEEIVACAEAGVAGYLSRDQAFPDLVDAIGTVVRDGASCPPRVAAALMRRMGTLAAERHSRTDLQRLTPREREIVNLIDQGLSNKEIARLLCIEVRTVKNHVHNLLEKLNVHRRWEAAAVLREPAAR